MKRILTLSLCFVAAFAFLAAPVQAASARENQRLREGKITKTEAQHFVLQKFPRATIKSCVLTPGKEHAVWAVEIVKAGAGDVTRVQVDGRDGRILP